MDELSWYEDGSFLEWFIGKERFYKEHVTLEEAIQIAWENKACLYIQPEEQNAGLFIDYTEVE